MPSLPLNRDSIMTSSDVMSVSGRSNVSRTSVITHSGNLFEITAQDKAPKKDFCQLVVTKEKVLFRRWVISLRVEARSLRPLEAQLSHEDFLEDDSLQSEVKRVFGLDAFNKTVRMCHGQVDWLARMPLPIVLYIISFLDIVDVANLSQVNSFFREISSNDIIWEELFFKYNDQATEELIDLALEKGWKHIFFANKLHLRVLLSRRQKDKNESSSSTPQATPRVSRPPSGRMRLMLQETRPHIPNAGGSVEQ